ncbi:hypothetical protein [Microbacterium sp. T32]|uniref:hypothetical protein n=1 Tax=Microbacterium sp. T32 TaxID=1776083 RepID=UPI000A746DA7|nr:hypothetical protein [Microbacterium sp. T32]
MPGFCEDHGRRHLDRYECGEMYRAEAAAARDAENQARAERIADGLIRHTYRENLPERQRIELRTIATAAALQALTEKENAR